MKTQLAGLVQRSDAAAVGFVSAILGTIGMMAAQIPIPEPWWGVLGAAGLWAWRATRTGGGDAK